MQNKRRKSTPVHHAGTFLTPPAFRQPCFQKRNGRTLTTPRHPGIDIDLGKPYHPSGIIGRSLQRRHWFMLRLSIVSLLLTTAAMAARRAKPAPHPRP